MNNLRILIADDHDLGSQRPPHVDREALRMECLRPGRSGREAVELAAQHHPDIVVIDIYQHA